METRISVRRSFLDKDFRFLICKTRVLILKSYCHRKALKPIQELGTEKGPKWSSLLTCLSWDIEPNPSRDFHRSTLTCPLPTLRILSSFPSYSLLRLFVFQMGHAMSNCRGNAFSTLPTLSQRQVGDTAPTFPYEFKIPSLRRVSSWSFLGSNVLGNPSRTEMQGLCGRGNARNWIITKHLPESLYAGHLDT